LFSTSLQSEVCTKSYGLQSCRNSNFENFGIPNLKQNDIWMHTPWLNIENTMKGKVVATPKFGLWWVRVCHGLSVHQKCSNHALTNLLFGLCRFVWIIDMLVTQPSPILELQHAPLPPKCYELRSVPQFFLLLLFPLLDSH
jgi:hypothetical protein